MKEHLKPDEISTFVTGASNAAADEHIRECAACRLEAERLTAALSMFRDSVRNWSLEHESPVRVNLTGNKTARRKVPLRWLGWGAVATACLIAGLVLPREAGKPVSAPRVAPAMTDAELLIEVNRELSEAVPPSLEPIALNQNRNQ